MRCHKMFGFVTGIDAIVKGYTSGEAELKYTPKGNPVMTRRVGCGGTSDKPATWLDVQLWGVTAEKMNQIGSRSGLAIIVEGQLQQKRWNYNGKWYEKIELMYVKSCQIQTSEKGFTDLPIEKKSKFDNNGVGNGESEGETEVEPDDIPF